MDKKKQDEVKQSIDGHIIKLNVIALQEYTRLLKRLGVKEASISLNIVFP